MFTQDDYINEIETARENGEKKGRELGLEAGRAEGKVEGKAEGKVEVAKAMKGDGMSCEQISRFTGLTKAQIEALAMPLEMILFDPKRCEFG